MIGKRKIEMRGRVEVEGQKKEGKEENINGRREKKRQKKGEKARKLKQRDRKE